jgi:hypothetical protein
MLVILILAKITVLAARINLYLLQLQQSKEKCSRNCAQKASFLGIPELKTAECR